MICFCFILLKYPKCTGMLPKNINFRLVLGNACSPSIKNASFHSSNLQKCFQRYKSTFTSDISKIPASKVRNIGIIAHIDAGKTTTTERMIYYSGLSSHIGNVDEGDTVTDYLTQERDRGITIQSAAVTIPWNKHRINILDTPGHADFTFEVIRSLRVLDGAVTILDAVAGVEAQTEKVWKQAKDLGIPVIAYINKMDRDGAGFGRTVKEIVGRLGTRTVLVNIPYFEEEPVSKQPIFKGIIDVFDKKLLLWDQPNLKEEFGDGKDVKVVDLANEETADPELYDQVLKCREAAIEQLGEFNEELIDIFFETEDYMAVPSSALKKALRQSTLKNEVVPVLCGASFKNIGVQPLLDAVNEYLPSPLDITAPEVIANEIKSSKNAKKRNLKNKAKAKNANDSNKTDDDSYVPVVIDKTVGCVVNNNPKLTTALAFKVLTHPNRGIMVFVRVYSGKLQATSTIINTRTKEKVKIGKLLLMHGDSPQEVTALNSGDIGVITGTDSITTGDTLIGHAVKKDGGVSTREASMNLLPIVIPPPVFSVSLLPHTVADKRKLESSIQILIREDPSLQTSYDEETDQLILSGMGELHLEIAKDRLVNDMQVKAEIGKVQVTYKETITANTPTVSKTIEASSDSVPFSISLSVESFEGPVEETHYATTPDTESYILDFDNNIVVFENGSTPHNVQVALEKETWALPLTYEMMINTLLSGVTAALQVGGTIARLPLHSIAVRVHSWSLPTDTTNIAPLIQITRQAIHECISSIPENAHTMMEPIMKVSVFVGDDDLGAVTQDLMGARNATINSIDEDASSSSEQLIWAKEQAEKTYTPYDPTSRYTKEASNAGKKIVRAECPLKEMVGYLPKLRSITKGRGIYDMEYLGMRRTSAIRARQILESY